MAVVVARLAANDEVPVDQLAIAVAVLIVVARPGNRVGELLALGAAAWGVGEGLLSLGLRGNLEDSAAVAGRADSCPMTSNLAHKLHRVLRGTDSVFLANRPA